MSRKERQREAQNKRIEIANKIIAIVKSGVEEHGDSDKALDEVQRWASAMIRKNPQQRMMYVQGLRMFCDRVNETHDKQEVADVR